MRTVYRQEMTWEESSQDTLHRQYHLLDDLYLLHDTAITYVTGSRDVGVDVL